MNSFIYKLLDSDYFRILHVRWTILTPLIIPLCNSHCLRNLSQKKCLHELFALLSAESGAPPLGPTKCATKGAGKSKKRDRIFWIESRFAWVEAAHYTTNQTHHIDLTWNIGLHVSGLPFFKKKLARARAQIWWGRRFQKFLDWCLGSGPSFWNVLAGLFGGGPGF